MVEIYFKNWILQYISSNFTLTINASPPKLNHAMRASSFTIYQYSKDKKNVKTALDKFKNKMKVIVAYRETILASNMDIC